MNYFCVFEKALSKKISDVKHHSSRSSSSKVMTNVIFCCKCTYTWADPEEGGGQGVMTPTP